MDRESYNKVCERSDQISTLMGQYLLRGYRMLGSACETCGTVLLKFRDEPDYCIGCQEVDVKTTTVPQETSPANPKPSSTWQVTSNADGYAITHQTSSKQADGSPCDMVFSDSVNTAINSLNDKIVWASEALKNCLSVEESIHYCKLLKSCAEALKALRNAETLKI